MLVVDIMTIHHLFQRILLITSPKLRNCNFLYIYNKYYEN